MKKIFLKRYFSDTKILFKRYNTKVGKASKRLSCPKCGVMILPRYYQAHCTKIHHLDSRIHCVWCWGAKSWRSGEKQNNADHLTVCFKKFYMKTSTTLPSERTFMEYNITVNEEKKIFPCPECNIILRPKDYQAHCTKNHDLNSATRCVWCRGAKSWRKGRKTRNADHLIKCFRKFIDNFNEPKPSPGPVAPIKNEDEKELKLENDDFNEPKPSLVAQGPVAPIKNEDEIEMIQLKQENDDFNEPKPSPVAQDFFKPMAVIKNEDEKEIILLKQENIQLIKTLVQNLEIRMNTLKEEYLKSLNEEIIESIKFHYGEFNATMESIQGRICHLRQKLESSSVLNNH